MALTNIIGLADTAHVYTASQTIDPNHPGAYSIDGDYGSYFGLNVSHGGDGSCQGWVQSQHNFSRPRTITEIHVKAYCSGYAYGNHDPTVHIEYYIKYSTDNGATWNEVILPYPPNTQTHYYIDPDKNVHIDTMDFITNYTISGLNLAGVTNILCYVYCYAYSWGSASQNGSCYIYEIQAYGQVYDDTGLRIYTSGGVVSIGGEYPAGSSHHFRCYGRGNKVWGIPLLAVNDPNASKVRVYHNGVFALPKAT